MVEASELFVANSAIGPVILLAGDFTLQILFHYRILVFSLALGFGLIDGLHQALYLELLTE